MNIDGILNLNKPGGRTSFSMVSWLRRITGEKRIGHAGTLDPIATGVLPVCFGQATRVVQFIVGTSKTYLAEIELGTATDTFDREGKIIQRDNPDNITPDLIRQSLASFEGTIEQVPPAYSALKHRGSRAYELARAGMPVIPKPRWVEITSLELIDCQLPTITVKVECSKGTYVRSLAHDLGQYLGCGAHLKNLTRLRCGPFFIEEALAPHQIEDAVQQGTFEELLSPVDSPLLHWKAVVVSGSRELAIRNGASLPLGEADVPSGKYCRAYDLQGHFIALLRFIPEKRLWHPEKVFPVQRFPCCQVP